MNKVQVVEENNAEMFELKCSDLIEAGYRIDSTFCGFLNSVEYDFQSIYQAILVKED